MRFGKMLFVILIFTVIESKETDNTHKPAGFLNDVMEVGEDLKGKRERRDSEDEVFKVIDKLASSARLVTAISLQNGLINGSFPPDKVLAELLNIEPSVNFTRLESFNSTNIDNFFERLRDPGPSFEGIGPTEKTILVLNQWRIKYSDVGDVGDISVLEKYFNAINSIIQFNISSIDLLINSADKNLIESIPTLSGAGLVSSLEKLHSNLEQLINGSQMLQHLRKSLQEMATPPQLKFCRLLDAFFLGEAQIQRNLTDIGKLGGELEKVMDLIPAANWSMEDMGILWVISTLAPRASSLKYTNGFLNRSADIEKVPKDAEEPFFKADGLQKGVDPIQLLKPGLSELVAERKALLEHSKALAQAQRIGALYEALGWRRIDSKTLGAVGECVEEAKKIQMSADFYAPLSGVFEKVQSVGRVFHRIVKLIERMEGSFHREEFVEMKTAISFSSTDPGHRESEAVRIQEDVMRIPALEGIEKLQKDLESLKTLMKSASVLGNIPDGKKHVTDVMAMAETRHLVGFFEKLKSTSEPLELTSTAIQLKDEIAGGIEKDMLNMTRAVNKSIATLKSLRVTAGSVKRFLPSEVQNLQRLGDFWSVSKAFGDAVTALDGVRNVLKRKEELRAFLKFGDVVAARIRNLTSGDEREELEDGWGDFGTTKRDVEGVLNGLERMASEIQMPQTTTKMLDYLPVFQGFSDLRDVDLRMSRRRKVWKTLNLTDAFDELESLDLSLAKFNTPLVGTNGTLKELDEVFATLLFPPEVVAIGSSNEVVDVMKRRPFAITDHLYLAFLLVPLVCFILACCCFVRRGPRRTNGLERKSSSSPELTPPKDEDGEEEEEEEEEEENLNPSAADLGNSTLKENEGTGGGTAGCVGTNVGLGSETITTVVFLSATIMIGCCCP